MVDAVSCFVICCGKLPAASFCVLVFLLHAVVIDYYLVENLSSRHLIWVGADALNLILLIVCLHRSYSSLTKGPAHSKYSIAWISWLAMSMVLASKVIVIFEEFAVKLDEKDPSIFGPNILKTDIALASCIFLLLLTSQHNSPMASENRTYIEELTGTVVFDLLDTVDILEILFDQEMQDLLWNGLREIILTVATLNLLIPTVPLLTLSSTQYGVNKLRKRFIYLHRLLIVLAVNVPNLVVRMILWHVFSVTISPFTLKNIILIIMTVYEFYHHKREKLEEHEHERMEMQQSHKDCENGNGSSNVSETQRQRKESDEHGVSNMVYGYDQNTTDHENRRNSAFFTYSTENGDEPVFPIEERMVTCV